jgi:hypothetical protein
MFTLQCLVCLRLIEQCTRKRSTRFLQEVSSVNAKKKRNAQAVMNNMLPLLSEAKRVIELKLDLNIV